MGDDGDDFAPGALFKRYGQDKKKSLLQKRAVKPAESKKILDVEKGNELIQKENPKETTGELTKNLPLPAEPSTSNNGTSGVEKKETTPSVIRPLNFNALLVNPKQRGNPILKSVCNVTWEFNETIVPDYVMGATTCALFLSVRYHNLNPDYIHERLKQLGKAYDLRVLLVQVDTSDPHHALKHLTRICILANLTLVLAWSPEEAGRILETYKSFEHKPPDLIMERTESNPYQKMVNALTSIRSINKTDASTLLSTFGSLESLLRSSRDTVGLCPGLGPQKAKRLYNVLHQPFLKSANASKGTKRKNDCQ